MRKRKRQKKKPTELVEFVLKTLYSAIIDFFFGVLLLIIAHLMD